MHALTSRGCCRRSSGGNSSYWSICNVERNTNIIFRFKRHGLRSCLSLPRGVVALGSMVVTLSACAAQQEYHFMVQTPSSRECLAITLLRTDLAWFLLSRLYLLCMYNVTRCHGCNSHGFVITTHQNIVGTRRMYGTMCICSSMVVHSKNTMLDTLQQSLIKLFVCFEKVFPCIDLHCSSHALLRECSLPLLHICIFDVEIILSAID